MTAEAAAKDVSFGSVDFDALPQDRLEAMAQAAEVVVDCHRVLAKSGENMVSELLRGIETFYEWDHYPDGDIYDHETHSQYYYHAHPKEERPGEHGHFHTFLRPKGMPKGLKPAKIPEYEAPEDPDDNLSHLAAVSMDDHGVPIKLFTVNRWVSADVWYRAEDVITMLDHFDMDLAHPSWVLNQWITGMIHLFRPQIEALLIERDRIFAAWQAEHPDTNAFKDEDLEVLSTLDISVDDQVRAVTAALERRAG